MNRLLVVLAVAFGVLWLGAPAYADPTSDAVAAFKSSHVYNASNSGYQVDTAEVNDAIGGRPIYFAVFPSGDAAAQAATIGPKVPGAGLVGVVVGNSFRAVSNLTCPNSLDAPVSDAVAEHKSELKAKNATGLLVGFAQRYDAILKKPNCPAGNGSAAAPSSSSSEKSGGNGGLILAGLLGAGALGGGAFMLSRRRKKQRELADLRAEVVSLYDRLGADVSNIDPKDNETARQALADASERYTATGSQLAQADSPGKFAVAKRTALEGLYAARTAREELGLDPGPDLPPLYPSTGQTMSEPTTVNVRGQDVQGYPSYQPGAPYYYGGGGGYAAGWYAMPFWETLLLGSVLTGGFGGWGGGGFDSGYREGYQEAQHDVDREQAGAGDSGWAGGGDSGGWGGGFGGGGGDWGGGGGDWGGGGGGGDFGGGGGGDW